MTRWVSLEGKVYKVEFTPGETEILVDGTTYVVDFTRIDDAVFSLLWTAADGHVRSFEGSARQEQVVLDGERFAYALLDPRRLHNSGSGGSEAGPKLLRAPMPGRIVRILVEPGEAVAPGQSCVVIEAMKMQNELKAGTAGTVAKLHVCAGDTVSAGTVLLEIE